MESMLIKKKTKRPADLFLGDLVMPSWSNSCALSLDMLERSDSATSDPDMSRLVALSEDWGHTQGVRGQFNNQMD